MNALAKERRLRCVTVDFLPLPSMLLSLFLVLGILAGYALSLRFQETAGEELGRYLEAARSGGDSPTAAAALRTLVCYFRSPLSAFLLGFSSIGALLLPLLFSLQGFVLSFSLFSFAGALGREGFGALAALFGIRLLFVLPCTLLLGSAALEKAHCLALLSLGGGKRSRPVSYGASYWYRSLLCALCLLLGAALELWLTPVLLSL